MKWGGGSGIQASERSSGGLMTDESVLSEDSDEPEELDESTCKMAGVS